MSAAASRIAVIGGGVIGLSVAWELSRRAADVGVLLIDPDPGGTAGASWVAGGMLAPVAEAHQTEPDLVRLGVDSARRWPEFAAELSSAAGLDVGYTQAGTLVVARDRDDAAELAVLRSVQERFGGQVEALTTREARRREPALAPTIRGALWLAGDHQVDNRRLLAALCAAIGSAPSVEVVPRVAGSVRSDGDRIRVEFEGGGAVDVDAAVLCTGAWSVPISLGGREVVLPVRPVKGQIVRVQGVATAVLPTHTVRGCEVYVIPRAGGEIAIGATSEELGYDTRVTAGAVQELLDRAWELLPGIAEATFVEVAAGLRPGSPDNLPLIGALGGGLHVAAGHHRNGVLLAPATAALVADQVLGTVAGGGAAAIDAAPFAPDRFAVSIAAAAGAA